MMCVGCVKLFPRPCFINEVAVYVIVCIDGGGCCVFFCGCVNVKPCGMCVYRCICVFLFE